MKKQRSGWSRIAKYDLLIVFVVVDVLLMLIYALAMYPIQITLGFSIVGGFLGAGIYFLFSRMRRRR